MTTVKFKFDPDNPPVPTKAELARMEAIRDEDIDYSDIPELDDEFWKHAKIVRSPQKPVVTMRVDQETVAYFKGDDPKGYTGRMAAVLRAYVRAQRVG